MWSRFWLLSGLKRQASSVGSGESPVTPAKRCHAARPQLRFQVTHGVGELREDHDLVIGVVHREQPVQSVQLGIAGRVPIRAALLHHIQQSPGIGSQVSASDRHEQAGRSHLKRRL